MLQFLLAHIDKIGVLKILIFLDHPKTFFDSSTPKFGIWVNSQHVFVSSENVEICFLGFSPKFGFYVFSRFGIIGGPIRLKLICFCHVPSRYTKYQKYGFNPPLPPEIMSLIGLSFFYIITTQILLFTLSNFLFRLVLF